jgi:hypothetical protein
MLSTPRPIPPSRAPVISGGLVVLIALPVFLIGGWGIAGWGLAAGLWLAYQALGLVFAHLPLGLGNLRSSGAVAFGRMFRAIALMVLLIVIAASNTGLGLSAAIVYALAYTAELVLSLIVYFEGEARR